MASSFENPNYHEKCTIDLSIDAEALQKELDDVPTQTVDEYCKECNELNLNYNQFLELPTPCIEELTRHYLLRKNVKEKLDSVPETNVVAENDKQNVDSEKDTDMHLIRVSRNKNICGVSRFIQFIQRLIFRFVLYNYKVDYQSVNCNQLVKAFYLSEITYKIKDKKREVALEKNTDTKTSSNKGVCVLWGASRSCTKKALTLNSVLYNKVDEKWKSVPDTVFVSKSTSNVEDDKYNVKPEENTDVDELWPGLSLSSNHEFTLNSVLNNEIDEKWDSDPDIMFVSESTSNVKNDKYDVDPEKNTDVVELWSGVSVSRNYESTLNSLLNNKIDEKWDSDPDIMFVSESTSNVKNAKYDVDPEKNTDVVELWPGASVSRNHEPTLNSLLKNKIDEKRNSVPEMIFEFESALNLTKLEEDNHKVKNVKITKTQPDENTDIDVVEISSDEDDEIIEIMTPDCAEFDGVFRIPKVPSTSENHNSPNLNAAQKLTLYNKRVNKQRVNYRSINSTSTNSTSLQCSQRIESARSTPLRELLEFHNQTVLIVKESSKGSDEDEAEIEPVPPKRKKRKT